MKFAKNILSLALWAAQAQSVAALDQRLNDAFCDFLPYFCRDTCTPVDEPAGKFPCESSADCCEFECEDSDTQDFEPVCQDSGRCECSFVGYLRVFMDFNDRQLFSLMEGDELEHHLSLYERRKKDPRMSLGLCSVPSSIHHNRKTTHSACFHPEDQLSNFVRKESRDTSTKPWAAPSLDGGVLLAADPGIWSYENFVNEDETTQLLELVNKYGYDREMLGRCKHDKRHLSNAHPMDGKMCFKISPENVCEGPYDISKCEMKTDPEDAAFLQVLLTRFKDMWPAIEKDPYPYAKFQLTKGDKGTAPVDLHTDNEKIVSFILYLSDGGAAMIFPNANVTVIPKKGTAHTWLNGYDKTGKRNPMSDHAVQAHPSTHEGRLVMLFEIASEEKCSSAV